MRIHARPTIAALAIAVFAAAALQVAPPSSATETTPSPTPAAATEGDSRNEVDPSEVPLDDREAVLGSEWENSTDIAWTTIGDAAGFHVYSARQSEGYAWARVATLTVEGFDTDRWVGNACLIEGGERLGVVYAPRSFANDEVLFSRGAFGAIVDLETGTAELLGSGYTLAYFNPGCGSGGRATFTQYGDEETRFVTVDGDDPTSAEITEVAGQLTSAVPTSEGVVGASAADLVAVDAKSGALTSLTKTAGAPYDLTVARDGSIAYLDRVDETATVHLLTPAGNAEPLKVATGDLGSLGLERDGRGKVHVTGAPEPVTPKLPAAVNIADNTPINSTFSSTGALVVEDTVLNAVGESTVGGDDVVVDISATATNTLTKLDFEVASAADEGTRQSELPQVTGDQVRSGFGMSVGGPTRVIADPHSPISDGGTCAVARNDPALQAIQPNLDEVEWAADQAVLGTLSGAQSASMFPRPSLSGGGRVPAQVLLGILAQESNFWQASKFTVPGVSGNPLVGNYFGIDRDSSAANAWWQIDFSDADCGYGIAQVTDGMRVGQMAYSKQVAIATDYKANISRALQILIEKWNQTHDAGLVVNDGNPKYLENWFYAVWAYNTGFYPETQPGAPWGVGWLNNPVNPIYAANRGPFLDGSPSDAATPQFWPYPERVMGFAAHSAYFLDSVAQGTLGDTYNYATAFTPAWWTSADGENGQHYRELVKPPVDLFCDPSNNCDPDGGTWVPAMGPSGSPCYNTGGGVYDLKCWYHQPAQWKSDCSTACGYEYLSYGASAAKPAGANSFPPNCTKSGLPAGALVIDNLPSGTATARAGCSPVPSNGTFQFTFPAGPNNDYASKIDVHQLGAGFNGQFWLSHVRIPETDAAFSGALDVAGTWTLDRALTGWAKVFVHMPSHGAWTQQATYEISTGSGTPVLRSVNQRNYADTWVSLGTLQMTGTPSITLRNKQRPLREHQSSEGAVRHRRHCLGRRRVRAADPEARRVCRRPGRLVLVR